MHAIVSKQNWLDLTQICTEHAVHADHQEECLTLNAHDDGIWVGHVLSAQSDNLFPCCGGHSCGHRLQEDEPN